MGVCGRKEVLIDLQEGKNRIRMFNDHGLISHIRGIELIANQKKNVVITSVLFGLFKKITIY